MYPIKQFDLKYFIKFEIVIDKSQKFTKQEKDKIRHQQIQEHILNYVKNGVLETDSRLKSAHTFKDNFIKKYSIYENLEIMYKMPENMQTWFYHNHLYFKLLSEILKVYMHAKYHLVLNRFLYLNCKYMYIEETTKNVVANFDKLQLQPTEIMIEVSLLCELLRSFDYSEVKNLMTKENSLKTLKLKCETIGHDNPTNFLEYLPEFHFLNTENIYNIVSNCGFVNHSYFQKIIKKF